MRTPITTIETTGTVGQNRQHLQLDDVLPLSSSKRVRVIVLYEADHEKSGDEVQWLKAAANSSAFDFLNDPAEDIYSLSDGKPFYDQV